MHEASSAIFLINPARKRFFPRDARLIADDSSGANSFAYRYVRYFPATLALPFLRVECFCFFRVVVCGFDSLECAASTAQAPSRAGSAARSNLCQCRVHSIAFASPLEHVRRR
jgi:hypothetical protein